jgi:hypothetical protein
MINFPCHTTLRGVDTLFVIHHELATFLLLGSIKNANHRFRFKEEREREESSSLICGGDKQKIFQKSHQ